MLKIFPEFRKTLHYQVILLTHSAQQLLSEIRTAAISGSPAALLIHPVFPKRELVTS
jgi:hypothetical protein